MVVVVVRVVVRVVVVVRVIPISIPTSLNFSISDHVQANLQLFLNYLRSSLGYVGPQLLVLLTPEGGPGVEASSHPSQILHGLLSKIAFLREPVRNIQISWLEREISSKGEIIVQSRRFIRHNKFNYWKNLYFSFPSARLR